MKILHITYGFNGGGVGFVIANYCACSTRTDLLYHIVGESMGERHFLHDRFEASGFGVFYITPKRISLFKNVMEIRSILKRGNYDAVHVHFEEWSFLYLGLAKRLGVPIRICHAHMAHRKCENEKPHYRIFRLLLNRWATCRIACSTDAAQALFKGHSYTVLNNALDLKKYCYDPEKRRSIRQALSIGDEFVVGTVGRLSYQKNPQFMVEIFRKIHEMQSNSILLFVGQGELEKETRDLAVRYGLQKEIRFLGLRADVPDLLQAMDAFVLPSRFEGLGMVYVEAQAAGLKTFATDAVVPKAVDVADGLMTYISIDSDAEGWATAVIKQASQYTRRNTCAEVAQKGFDLRVEMCRLENIYLEQFARMKEYT